MSDAGKHHGDTMFVCGIDNFLITHRAARLNDRGDARLCGSIYTIAEGEKASDAITDPGTESPSSAAFKPAILALTTRLI